MALFLLAYAVDRFAGVDVDHAVASDPVQRVTCVDVDHAVASDPLDRTSSVDLNPSAMRQSSLKRALLTLPWVIFGLAGWVCGRRG